VNGRPWWFVLQVVTTVFLLTMLFRGFDWASFRRLWQNLPSAFYLLSFAALLAGHVLSAFRWYLNMRSVMVSITFRTALRQWLVAVFVNNFLPSTVGGDSAKIYYLGPTGGYGRLAATVVADRLLAALALATVAMVWPPRLADDTMTEITANAMGVVWAGLITVLTLCAVAPRSLWGLQHRATRWPALAGVAAGVIRLADDTRGLLRQPRVLLRSVALTLAGLALMGLVYQQFVTLVTGATPQLLAVVGTVAAVGTLSSVPIAVNGLGLREQLHLVFLAGFAVAPGEAAAISLLMLAHLLVISMIGAVAWLRPRETQHRS
jgi:uncharacterized membrane protein YbhN (UPF0104 family)